MAKRDTLYTVNRWNKPFFEETRKKLYPLGGDLTNNPIYGLRTGQAGLRWGYGDTGGIDYTASVSNLTRQNSLNRAVTTFNQYNNPSYYQDIARTNYIYGWDKPLYGGVSDNSSASNPPEYKVESYNPNWLDNVSKITNSITNTAKTAIDAVKTTNTINSQINSLSSAASNTPKFLQGVTAPLSNTLMKSNMDKMASDFGKTLNDLSTLKITDNSGLKHLSLNPNSVTKPGGISNIGKAGVGIGASILGEVGGNLISDGFSTVPGTLINQIGSAAGTVLSMIPGVGWVWGPAVTLGSKLLGGLYNRVFGSEYKDNGATAYTNQLNALNPNGSNEYLANLMASVGLGPQATSRNGWLNHSAERKADRTNAAQDLALNRFQRGVRDAFQNNNTRQLWNAYNDYVTYGAMGGRIKRKKCNCKATGGFLNNAMLDSASATGYNFLSDLTNIQMQNNQNKQDMGTSLGNSFTGLSNGTLFANGGGININPAHKGEFTAKAKRHGMGVQQFANHVLAHKDKFPSSTVKQAVFAKNANTWKKAFGGKLNYGKDKDNRDSGFFNDPTLYELGGTLQAAGSNWGRATEINAGGTHEESPYDGVQVGVDPEGTPNLVEEGEVIFNDYVFSNRIKCPKEICKVLRVGVKKDGFTFAEVAKKLLKESKERPNDPISKRGLDANMQKLEDAQEEVKQKMEAEEAVEQFNSLPPEQQVAIMNQEGAKAQDAVAQQQMAQELQNMPPEQQQAIAQQMMAEQAAAQGQGMPQGPSPEEQAMMQQQAMQQQTPQGINPQEALAQAAAMQQQAIAAYGGKLCFGGRRFAEGGELGTEEGQMPEEQSVEQADPEMAKYSDEELQEVINEYEEAANGEKKVTKGKLARLKKKAEKAERELERRNSQGENPEEEQSNAAQGQRQEPTQEEVQAAAQAQAQQQMMEGQPQESIPQEGMSPEQAMMMQQQMGGGQMSPEEMAAMELQQQQGGQYAYGGKLYLTGGELMGMFGLNTDSDIAKAGWTPEMFGISSWYDEIPQSTVDEWVTKGNFPWLTDNRQSEKWIPNNTIRMAMTRGYNPFIPQKTPDQYNWHKPPTGAQSPFFTSGSWAQYYGEEPTKDTIIDNDKYKAFIEAYPNALAGLDYSDGITLGKIDDYMKNSPYWKLRQDWLWKHPDAKNNRLAYMANIAENNANAIDKNDAKKFSALGIYDFKKTDNGYTVTRKDGVTDDQEKQWWDAVTSDYKYGDMYNTPDGPLFRDIYIDQDTGDIMYTKPGSDWTQVGNPYQSFVAGANDNDPGYNQNIYFFKKNGDSTGNAAASSTTDKSQYLTSAYTPSVDWTGVGLGIAPGLTGLGFQLARGVPDMSEIDNAVAAYERNTGTMIAPHLTHGLIRPAIIDPRVVGNRMDAQRLGTNRLLMNTGSTPSRGATILANDNSYIGQIGQAMINNWKENRAQEQAAAAFNRETNTTNANILNQVDQFNAQTQAALAKDAAQMRYQAAKDKIAARDAYYQGLLGNIGSIFQGGYQAWRENQRRNDRNRLAASGVFGETNGILDDWLGINKIDPDTHLVVRGPQRGKYYWINPNTGKEEYLNGQPPLSISFDTTLKYPKSKSQGGKIRKSKKRKGYTF